MKHKRQRKHNFIEVENEITYEESIVNKTRAEKRHLLITEMVHLIPFCHFTIDVSYTTILICVSAKLNILLCIWSPEIIKMNFNTLTLQQQ